MTDDELIERALAGSTDAFGQLVERHRSAVYRAALAALGNEADAEDIAQEALVLAFRRLDQFRGDASVRTWMVAIGWRLALTRRRGPIWRLKKKMMAPDSELDVTLSVLPSPEVQMISAQLFASVKREIRRLSPKLRDALLLAAAGDLTQDEIAKALNIPPATFRGRVFEARRRIKERIGH